MKFDPARRKAMTTMAALPVAASMGEVQARQLFPPANPIPSGFYGETSPGNEAVEYTPQQQLRDLRSNLAAGHKRSRYYEKNLRCERRQRYLEENVNSLKSVSNAGRRMISHRHYDRHEQLDWEEGIKSQIEDLLDQHPYLRTIQTLL